MLSLVWLRYDRRCCNETPESAEMSTEMHCTNQTSSSLPANTRRILNGVGRRRITINCPKSQVKPVRNLQTGNISHMHSKGLCCSARIFDVIRVTVAVQVLILLINIGLYILLRTQSVCTHRPLY